MQAEAPQIFDRKLVRSRRERSARLGLRHILGEIVAEELIDRLATVKRDFSSALVLGPRSSLAEAIRCRTGFCVDADLAMPLAKARTAVLADEEALPFGEGVFDLVISALSLHWLNDLPGALVQIRRSLKPDGLFLASLLGGDTLAELREALSQAEIETKGGLSARFSPTLDMRDMGTLMQRAGFALPVVDTDRLRLSFETPLDLMHALRDSAETNALIERRPLSRATLTRALEIYGQSASGGGITATFQLIYLSGWSPHESQQKPLQPGSARARLADALRTKEQPLKRDD